MIGPWSAPWHAEIGDYFGPWSDPMSADTLTLPPATTQEWRLLTELGWEPAVFSAL